MRSHICDRISIITSLSPWMPPCLICLYSPMLIIQVLALQYRAQQSASLCIFQAGREEKAAQSLYGSLLKWKKCRAAFQQQHGSYLLNSILGTQFEKATLFLGRKMPQWNPTYLPWSLNVSEWVQDKCKRINWCHENEAWLMLCYVFFGHLGAAQSPDTSPICVDMSNMCFCPSCDPTFTLL